MKTTKIILPSKLNLVKLDKLKLILRYRKKNYKTAQTKVLLELP